MAIQHNNAISGMVGNVVFYTANGKNIMRSRPRRVKQTAGMKKNAKEFGRASSISAAIRMQMEFVVPDKQDQGMRYRFDNCIRKWLRQQAATDERAEGFATIEGFELNEQSLLKDRLRVLPTVSWIGNDRIEIVIPELIPTSDIAALPFTDTVALRFLAMRCELGSRPAVKSWPQTKEIKIPYKQEQVGAQTISLELLPVPDSMTIVFFALNFSVYGAKKEDWCGVVLGVRSL